jgi:hypothetical protein
LSGAAEVELKLEEERDCPANTQADENPTPQISDTTESALLGSLSSRLAAAPTRLGRALKKVWMQRAQAGSGAKEPGAKEKENVTTISAPPEAEADGTEPIQAEAESTAPSTESKPDSSAEPQEGE